MRLIDADELLQTEKLLDTDIIRNSKEANWLYEQMLYDIANAPTIDAQPVVHAYWQDTGLENSIGDLIVCSNCHYYYNPEKNAVEMGRLPYHPTYCPNCGAKMDGKEERHD